MCFWIEQAAKLWATFKNKDCLISGDFNQPAGVKVVNLPLFPIFVVVTAINFSRIAHAAVAVDTELVILVDAQTYSRSDFDLIIDSAARMFEQPSLQDAVMNGLTGKMAASVILYNISGESVRVPWTQLVSTMDFQNFANSVRQISYPNAGGNINYATAISTASSQIAANGYSGTNRQITIIDDATGFYEAGATATRAARDTALSSNVDVINAIAFDAQYRESAVSNFYRANIASPSGTVSVVSTPQGGPKTAAQLLMIQTEIEGTAAQPTVAATALHLQTVPEPSIGLLSICGLLLTLRRQEVGDLGLRSIRIIFGIHPCGNFSRMLPSTNACQLVGCDQAKDEQHSPRKVRGPFPA